MAFSRNWLEQSEEAKKQGVCHTEEECRQMYTEIDPEVKGRAMRWFLGFYKSELPKIAETIATQGDDWISPYHFHWGMGARNAFRTHGFGERDFGIDNLDCIYKLLIEDAIRYWQLSLKTGEKDHGTTQAGTA